jgi:hypothetical protein
MGITSQAQNAIKAAFRVAGDAKKSITLKTSTSILDPVTSITSKSWADETAQGILTEYSKWNISQGIVQATDRRLVLQQADFTNEPDIDDNSRIVIDSVTYLIVPPLKKDSFGAIYELQLRVA